MTRAPAKETRIEKPSRPGGTARPRGVAVHASPLDDAAMAEVLSGGDVRAVVVEKRDGSLRAFVPGAPRPAAKCKDPDPMPEQVRAYERNGWSCRFRKGQWQCSRRIGGLILSVVVEA